MTDFPQGSDPAEPLRRRLKRLHREAGEPGTREIARRTGHRITYGTVATVLRCTAVPRWESLELVVRALYGDCEEFKALWIGIRESQDGASPAAAPELTVSDYFCYISQSKIERLHAAMDRTVPPDPGVDAFFAGSSFGRSHLLYGGSLDRPLLVSRLREVIGTLARRGEIAEFDGGATPSAHYLHHVGAFSVPGAGPGDVDPATTVLRLAGLTRPELRLDCSLRYFSETVDGRYVVSSELNALVYGNGCLYFDTVFVVLSRGPQEIAGSPLYLKLYTGGRDVAL
ncbi:hypothetical protein [Actinoplanes auranticolor]|uniref:Uncharacterized protein n=1 Tax=Actinoplanes auranticolor TaxID=47988 RepID=A0A919S8Y3_9ACTN|nr:hypothetical protein [Actinoplanes auranticolor]GIM66471.1 hypothetical protein Aau02nite_23080 [Actinoplanes auranticolor]